MNNEFLNTINYLKGLLESDTDLTYVAHGVSNNIDLDKKGSYPLAHIQLLNFNPVYQMGMISFLFEVHILKIRDINKQPSNDKWLRNDNELDNYNTTINIANRLFAKLKNLNDLDIEVVSQTQPEVLTLEFMNMLDGCKFQLELAITNQVDGCA
jgi:hypothetical protein